MDIFWIMASIGFIGFIGDLGDWESRVNGFISDLCFLSALLRENGKNKCAIV